MRKVISRKLYDTDTAKLIGEYSVPEYGRADFHFFEEFLYLKKTGEYFLYGKGGPASKYATPAGQNSWMGGEKITPLTYDQAREWAETSMEADDYLKHFEAIGDDTDASFIVTLSAQDKVILDRLRSDGRTISEVISDLLRSSNE